MYVIFDEQKLILKFYGFFTYKIILVTLINNFNHHRGMDGK